PGSSTSGSPRRWPPSATRTTARPRRRGSSATRCWSAIRAAGGRPSASAASSTACGGVAGGREPGRSRSVGQLLLRLLGGDQPAGGGQRPGERDRAVVDRGEEVLGDLLVAGQRRRAERPGQRPGVAGDPHVLRGGQLRRVTPELQRHLLRRALLLGALAAAAATSGAHATSS